MKVSDYVIQFLVDNHIDKVFSYIGKNAHLCDSIDKHPEIENVFTIHEQGAGFAADAYARVTGKSGVATVTSGPGATNLLTCIADCYFDSVPTLFIIGDVPPSECKGDRNIRQFGFQETDMVVLSESITKHAIQITDLKDMRYELEKAYFISQEGRKGPVLVSIPENLQFLSDFNPVEIESFFGSDEHKELLEKNAVNTKLAADIEKTVKLINQAERPVVLVGGGVRLAGAEAELMKFLEATQIPMVYSLMGKDSITSEYKYNLGFLGNFGTRHANLTIANSDLLIVLGSRLDNLQTGRKIETFAREAQKIQVDIDANELGIRVDMDLLIKEDVREFLYQLNLRKYSNEIDFWHEKVLSYKAQYPAEYNNDKTDRLGNQIVYQISKHLEDDDCVCVDVGEHQMLVAQSLKPKAKQRVLFSGGFGSMGFALPAAIGATLATGKRAIVITGDGGFQMNIQELEIIKRRKLPIKIFVINNESLHMVKLRQDAYLEGNSVGSINDYSVPNFKKIGKAYGIKSHQVTELEKIKKRIDKSLQNDDCEIIDIRVQADITTVEPRLDFNRSFEDMRPYLSEEEMSDQMVIEPSKVS
ncbi:thiamine pyrophosphate-binding protein [uncultured Cocleimonas sp.]|uniref:thiamine pyrophosphate-binding protein n=1 Tax=uncultured Cocleimonas sp. TaxID=1051587 RepID=UPI0026294865|nr:thiamine pyrophosphate-binding protein [uncultured Cocleimonas sp.]